MRLVLAALFASYVAVVAAMPHGHAPGHGTAHDRHECVACSTAGVEVSEPVLPDVEPRAVPLGCVTLEPASVPSSGAPLGAVPGQSPPAV